MFIFSIWFSFSACLSGVISLSCGIDNSPVEHVYEGDARIETYPWLGVLYYPRNKKRYTTAVVLVTRQIVIAAALEIDKLPKEDFRARARVVVGYNCSGPAVGIRDYTFHPDYSKNTFSAMALIQLETDHVTTELRPICSPPRALPFQDQEFYAMVFSEDCNRSKMTIHRMMFVSTEECKTYYRRAQLDIDTLWPTYTACAKSITEGYCVWRSGAVLVMKVGMRWRLMGIGVYGPGCQAPARFLDYGMYHEWVRRSVERIGRPAITKVAPNYLVLRRTLSNVQRFGTCDEGEVIRELYTESTEIHQHYRDRIPMGKYNFNLTLIGDVEYSCVVLRADYKAKMTNKTPKLRLTRYCAGLPSALCFSGVQFIQIQFNVEITFKGELAYSVTAYGRTVEAIDPLKAHKYANTHRNIYPKLYRYKYYTLIFVYYVEAPNYPLYGKKKMKTRVVTGFPNKTTTTTIKPQSKTTPEP